MLLCREVCQTAATALLFDETVAKPAEARTAAAQVCKCLAAWAWELNAKLTGPQKIRTTQVYSDDIVEILLPPSEAKWLQKQRSRPLQILGGLRRVLHRQWAVGNLASHLHRKLEEDLRELDVVVGGCERLFSSPLPPTQARHAMRCLFLWIMALPIALASSTSMAPLSIAFWVFLTTYIFVGIEEVGVQVEQPFEIIPMTQLCNIIMANLEEAFDAPPMS